MQRIYLRFFLLYNERSEQHYAIPTSRTGDRYLPGENFPGEKTGLGTVLPMRRRRIILWILQKL